MEPFWQWAASVHWWDGLAVAACSAAVSALTVIVMRWWDRRTVEWLITGYAYDETRHGKPTGRVKIELEVHNTGDQAAYDVRLVRCNGGSYEPWTTFEAGRVDAGQSFATTMSPGEDHWEQSWMLVQHRSSPVARNKSTSGPRTLLRQVTGEKNVSYFRSGGPSRTPQGLGHQLPASEGGQLG